MKSFLLRTGYLKRKLWRREEKWDEIRKSERTGRIRAERRLRELEKQLQQQSSNSTSTFGSNNPQNHETFTATIIGIVTSPYTKRMGTPRQPQLVPSSRGYIQFTVAAEALDGMTQYSHMWVIFVFHANTNSEASQKTKIRPPRAGGVKVGQLATRSPHRPNPIGLSLCRIVDWDAKEKRLHVRELDLVHGTPVLDVKPCVPWDVPPLQAFRVPDWVKQDDGIANVEFTNSAKDELEELVKQQRLSPLYTIGNDGFSGAVETLTQVLAQDPRSSHRGLKTNARGTTATTLSPSDATYSLIFGHTKVEFRVSSKGAQVMHVSAVDFDESAHDNGVPLMSDIDGSYR
ncbi:hypothetical protein MPSEU_000146700 [Mayamaea pseudoterrestris]|nr:hypothetical protein MPSEU_000146700 [Mayamaea pseudoterrestris]